MWIYVLIGLVVLLVLVLIIIATRPSEFRVSRKHFIAASPQQIFPHVNAVRNWEAWSPWAKRDLQLKQGYEGPEAGVGAVHWWSGNNDVGEGRMTIVESRPFESVTFLLEFVRPFKCQNDVRFLLSPQNGGTEVVWQMDGKNNFIGKTMSLVMNMDKMVGGDFEQGLASLKQVAEQHSQPPFD